MRGHLGCEFQSIFEILPFGQFLTIFEIAYFRNSLFNSFRVENLALLSSVTILWVFGD